jgi:hypothetical protein
MTTTYSSSHGPGMKTVDLAARRVGDRYIGRHRRPRRRPVYVSLAALMTAVTR